MQPSRSCLTCRSRRKSRQWKPAQPNKPLSEFPKHGLLRLCFYFVRKKQNALLLQDQPFFSSTRTCRATSFKVSKTPVPWEATASNTGSLFLTNSPVSSVPAGRWADHACSVEVRKESS